MSDPNKENIKTDPYADAYSASNPNVAGVPAANMPVDPLVNSEPSPRSVQASEQAQPVQQTQPSQPAQPAQQASAQQPWPSQAAQPQVAGGYVVAPAGVAPVYASAPQKKSHGWIIAIVCIACASLLILGSVVSCSSVMGSLFTSAGAYSADDAISDLHEPAIGVIELNGTIQYDNSACSPEGLKALLDRAESNDHIQAVILKVNSGGGVATAGEEMSQIVRDFSKPIVVVSQATNASAAYEISSQADYIFTDRTTAIGAIGVIMSVTDLSGLYDKLGISVDNITSADSKDAGSGTRPLTDEERAWYQSMVDQINDVFIKTVAEGRDMEIDEVKALANGLPYTGMDAVENGLADEIGSLEDAVEYLCDLLGYDRQLNTVDMMSRSSDLSNILDLLGQSDRSFDANDLKDALDELDGGNVAQ